MLKINFFAYNCEARYLVWGKKERTCYINSKYIVSISHKIELINHNKTLGFYYVITLSNGDNYSIHIGEYELLIRSLGELANILNKY